MPTAPSSPSTPSVIGPLLPIMAAVFVVFLITGLALPVLPLHVHEGLGLGTFVVGLVAGSQFAASLVSRVWAGSHSDQRGPKRAVIVGLLMAVVSGLFYLLSLGFLSSPIMSVSILLVGRAILGGAESFIITGAQSWALALAGPANSGKAISWIGTAMYAALGIGAPVGSLLFSAYGFVSVGLVTTLVPIAVLLVILRMQAVVPTPQARGALLTVAKAVWLPGIGLSFASLGFGAMTAFSVLLFVERGWEPASLSFTAFAVTFIAMRVFLGHLADRIGGARVALVFGLIEAAGQALIWISPSPWLGFVGAALTGAGYSLVYPALGLEAVRRAPPEARGLAVGIYTAFLDVALGILSPILGLIAAGAGLGSVFLVSSLIILCAVGVCVPLHRKP